MLPDIITQRLREGEEEGEEEGGEEGKAARRQCLGSENLVSESSVWATISGASWILRTPPAAHMCPKFTATRVLGILCRVTGDSTVATSWQRLCGKIRRVKKPKET